MTKLRTALFIFTAILFIVNRGISQTSPAETVKSGSGGWVVSVNDKGAITKLQMPFDGELVTVPWRSDAYGGPAWKGVRLERVSGDKLLFEGRREDQVYSLEYRDVDGKLTITAKLSNESSRPFSVEPGLKLMLGIDNEMKNPDTYFGRFFPTLLRCEKTHFWGYFQNPNGQILTIASPDPVASRNLEYVSQRHRIYTSSLDLLHKLPLPERHPQNLVNLAPGEIRSWSIVFQPVTSLDAVLPAVATICKAPALDLGRTTAGAGEIIDLTVHFDSDEIPDVTIKSPLGKRVALPDPKKGKKTLKYALNAPEEVGNYTITATQGEKQSEAIFHVRKPWGWYLRQARDEALRMQIKPMKHREGWLGFFSAYWAQSFFPDDKLLAQTEEVFDNFYEIMVDSTITDFYHDKPTWHRRPQNTSWMVGMMTARYTATKKMEDLEEAAKWGDHFIRKFQRSNGAFGGYTALTLGGKFLRELAFYERPLIEKSPIWKARYERHIDAVKKASENLLKEKDLGKTEGDATYEDTQAGSAWSLLALDALNKEDATLRKEFMEASLEVQGRHQCLTQALIPDGRMRNGTLRFWEAQYDVLTLPNMMNSPHGWTMRSQFGAFYLYLLTGEEQFLDIMNNAMGACVQAIDEKSGVLRWAFVPDPYIEAQQFVPDPENPGQGKHVPAIIGEQWVPMISDWWRVPQGEIGALEKFHKEGFQEVSQGWSCDNDVHEHFRVLTEQFIPNAFVLEREDGSIRTMNCQVENKNGTLHVKLPEEVVSRVHFNLKKDHRFIIPFAEKNIDETLKKGMQWIGPGGKPKLLR